MNCRTVAGVRIEVVILAGGMIDVPIISDSPLGFWEENSVVSVHAWIMRGIDNPHDTERPFIQIVEVVNVAQRRGHGNTVGFDGS